MRSPAVAWWHTSLRAIAVLNIALWSLAAVTLMRAHTSLSAAADGAVYLQLLLCAAYVGGCAYRSFLPVIDIPRIVLVDSQWSRVLIGRSVATVAELSFAAQWAFMLHRASLVGARPFVHIVSLAIVPIIVVAEGFSWYAVLTRGNRAHAAENSLWGLAAALVIAGMLIIGPHQLESVYFSVIAGGALYVAFICFYDVPMYWARWRAEQAGGARYLSIAEGIAEVRRRWIVSYRWEDWKDEVPWMTLYFTFGVWSSVWLVFASLSFGQGK